MTSPQMPVVRVEGTEAHVRAFLKDVNSRVSKIVRGRGNVIYVAIPAQELGWLDTVAKDTGVKKVEVQEFPAYEKAPCGIFTTQLRYHMGRCKKCTALRPTKHHDGEARTIVKVEGLSSLSLNGLISLMKGKMDEAMALAQEYDNVIKAVEKIPELQSQSEALARQMEEHRLALKYFTERK